MLSSLAAAAILAMAAGAAVPADAARKRSNTTAGQAYDSNAKLNAIRNVRSVRQGKVGGARLRRGTPTQASDSNKDKWIDVQSSSW
jgi:hypothetical protein